MPSSKEIVKKTRVEDCQKIDPQAAAQANDFPIVLMSVIVYGTRKSLRHDGVIRHCQAVLASFTIEPTKDGGYDVPDPCASYLTPDDHAWLKKKTKAIMKIARKYPCVMRHLM